jgi:hypothetical protein
MLSHKFADRTHSGEGIQHYAGLSVLDCLAYCTSERAFSTHIGDVRPHALLIIFNR